jgi:hypothetical protein
MFCFHWPNTEVVPVFVFVKTESEWG